MTEEEIGGSRLTQNYSFRPLSCAQSLKRYLRATCQRGEYIDSGS